MFAILQNGKVFEKYKTQEAAENRVQGLIEKAQGKVDAGLKAFEAQLERAKSLTVVEVGE